MTGLYDAAEAYEFAFSYRDVAGEVDSLQRWYGGRPGSVLELAAGPADHAIEFARRGVRAAALDRSAAMCARARDNAAQSGVTLAVHRADMTAFTIDDHFDLAFCMIDSIAHLLTLDALVAHLSAVREHLAVPGRYVVESGHPAEYLAGSKRVETEWDLDRAGHHVHIRWGKPDDEMDPVTQVTPYLVTITIDGEIAAEEIIANRFWTATELEAAGRLAGLTVSARYGDFREDLTLSDDRAWRMFTVFARGG